MKHLKVRTKLLILSGMLLGFLILAGITGLLGMRETVKGLETVYLDRVMPLRDLKTISDKYAVDVVDATHKARNGNLTLQASLKQIEQAQSAIDEHWKAYTATFLVPEEARQVEVIKGLMAKSAPAIERLKAILAAGNRDALAAFANTELYATIDPISDGLSHLIQIQLDVAKAEFDDGESHYHTAFVLLSIGSAIALVLGLGLAIVITRQITTQLGAEPGELAALTERIAQGNLVRPRDLPSPLVGVMASVERMREDLHSMIGHVVRSSTLLDERASQVSVASEQVVASSELQSESAASMAAAMEELTVSIAHIADNASETHDIADRASAAGQRGVKVIEATIAEMDRIDQLVADSTQRVSRLADDSRNIGTIGNVIREIAEQTNLLALNAAIEAARAGEQGRGFAVVADEVRKLAERTALSTSEIVGLVKTIQDNTDSTQSQIAMVSETVRKGKDHVSEAGGMMAEIGQAITRSLEGVESISDSLGEQRAASTQVASNVERVAQIVEENTAAQASVNQATHELQKLAADLNALGKRFVLA